MRGSSIGDVTNRLLGVVEERKAEGGVEFLGIPTGFSTVDLFTGGMQNDQMWIVAARTGGGKTSWALDANLNACRFDPTAATLFYSLEMSAEVLVNRMISRMTEVEGGRIIRGMIDDAEMQQIRLAAEELSDYHMHIIDNTATVSKIEDHAMRMADKQDVSMLTVDYLQLLQDHSGELPETERVGTISRTVRGLARPDKLDIPVLALAQLNRSSQTSDDKIPQLHQLKNSSNLEQDANVVVLLHRPAIDNRNKGAESQTVENDAKMIIAKNREGEAGMTEAQFFPRLTKWVQ